MDRPSGVSACVPRHVGARHRQWKPGLSHSTLKTFHELVLVMSRLPYFPEKTPAAPEIGRMRPAAKVASGRHGREILFWSVVDW